jgi:peptidylprolyl isomerase
VAGVIEGFAAAIVGQRVGSQVLVSIPPVYGYGEAGDGNTSPLAGQTLVFLIDIVSVDEAVSE